MIVGIGTDILEISRIEKVYGNERFIEKNFTESEIEMFKNKKAETAAGNFCCKEAVSKALGCGFSNFMPISIEILRNESGAPVVALYGNAKKAAETMSVKKIHASISHCGQYAVSFVVLEG